MKGLIEQRRAMMAARDKVLVMDIHHPGFVYYDITTEENDYILDSVYAGYYNRQAIVDGVLVPNSQLTYRNSVGGVKLPTAGHHIVYFKGENGQYLYTGVQNHGELTRYPRGTTNINFGMSKYPGAIALLEDTPPGINGYFHLNFTKVYIPVGSLNAYMATTWGGYGDRLTEIQYNIIED